MPDETNKDENKSESSTPEKNRKSSGKRRLSVKRRIAFAALASLLGTTLSLLLAEIALRCYVAARGWTPNCYATGLVFFVPHAEAGYSLRPNLKLRSTTYDVTVNSLGFRGSEIQNPASENTTRIAVLGGSSVFGYLVGNNLDSCAILEDELNARHFEDDHWFEVINAGVPGYNLTQAHRRFQSDIAPLEPDVVLLYLGWNDIPMLLAHDPEQLDRTPSAPAISQRILGQSTLYGFLRYRLFPPDAPQFTPPSSAKTNVSYAGGELFRQELMAAIKSIRAIGAQPVLATQVMASTSQAADMDPFLGSSTEQIEANRKIGRWLSNCIREIAREQAVPLIDCGADIQDVDGVLGDAIHLTEKGHRLVAESWLEGLVTILEQEAGVR